MNTVSNFMSMAEKVAMGFVIIAVVIIVLYIIKGYLIGRYPGIEETRTVVKQKQVTVDIVDEEVIMKLTHISEDMDNLEKRISILSMKRTMLEDNIDKVHEKLLSKMNLLEIMRETMSDEVFKVQCTVDTIEINNIKLTLIGLNEKLMTTEESITKCRHKMDELNGKYNALVRKEYERSIM